MYTLNSYHTHPKFKQGQWPVSVAHLEARLPGQQRSFMEIDHEIFFTVILSLPLIQEKRKNVHSTSLPLRGLILPSKIVIR